MAKTAEEYKALSIKEFTKAARRYETDRAGIYKMCRKDYPPILEEIKKENFDSLLDAGCGTAPMLSLLTERYPDKHYTGIDITPEMIHKARAKKLPNTSFLVGDCENLLLVIPCGMFYGIIISNPYLKTLPIKILINGDHPLPFADYFQHVN